MADGTRVLSSSPETLNLAFRNLDYSVPAKGGNRKQVLHNVSGQILSGHLTAIMGPSGAGKSSLLHVLSGFKTTGVRGTVLVNGTDRDLNCFRTQSCYITQDHKLLDRLTTLETLFIAARLKLTATQNEQRRIVSDIIDLLGLTKSRDTYAQCLSGGEKKRLSIGLELITNPPVMFFDEPTSGLDSVSSAQIMYHLRGLAESGRAIACVVHQPNSRLCSLFDDMILLSEGKIIYSGPMNLMVSVFEEAGFPFPEFYSRADFALEIACMERGNDLSKLIDKFKLIPEDANDNEDPKLLHGQPIQFENNEIAVQSLNQVCDILPRKPLKVFKEKRRKYATNQDVQFWVLLQRTLLCTYRDIHMCRVRVASQVVVGLLLGLIFYDIGNDAAKIMSNAACLFFFAIFLFYSNAMPTTMTFPAETSVFLREHLNNWYSLPSYFFAKCLANFPFQLVCPLCFLLAAYWITGQPNESWRFAMCFLPCFLLVITAQGLSMMIGAACGHEMGVFIVSVSTIPMLLFSGFFQRLQDIPHYIKWLTHLSPFKNAFEAVCVTLYGMDRPKLYCSEAFCYFKDPNKFLANMGMSDDNYWTDIMELCVWTVCTHVGLFFVIMWKIQMSK